jgi:hypothetical protein
MKRFIEGEDRRKRPCCPNIWMTTWPITIIERTCPVVGPRSTEHRTLRPNRRAPRVVCAWPATPKARVQHRVGSVRHGFRCRLAQVSAGKCDTSDPRPPPAICPSLTTSDLSRSFRSGMTSVTFTPFAAGEFCMTSAITPRHPRTAAEMK